MITPKNESAFVLTHLGLGDNILCMSMVNYLLQFYKVVYYVCKKKNQKNLELLIQDDRVKYLGVNNDHDISPNFGFNQYYFNMFTNKMDLYLCGFHSYKKQCHDFPLGFYDDVNIDRKVFWDYFKVNNSEDSKKLYNILVQNNIEKYIVVHNISSTGKVFNAKDIIKTHCKEDNLLIINFNENEYSSNHKYYELANQFINKPFADYIELIINASYVFLTDSSFFCIALQLPIKTDECYYLARENVCYDFLYDPAIFDPTKNKKFNQILI